MRTSMADHPRSASLLASVIVVAFFVFAHSASAQVDSPTAPPPAASRPFVFEVASVKASKSTESYGVRFTPDGASAKGIPLKYILQAAYNQYNDQYWFAVPAWLDSANFDIDAKFNPTIFKDPTDDQRRAMLQALLADRFKLALHIETRELPEYALVVAKGGPNLRDASPNTLLRDDKDQLFCRAGLTNFRQCTMAEFADVARIVGIDRIVVDQTGLTGRYDFELHYASSGASTPQGVEAPPDIYEAVQEQLGLKLKSIRGPVSVFVIDHVERPSEN